MCPMTQPAQSVSLRGNERGSIGSSPLSRGSFLVAPSGRTYLSQHREGLAEFRARGAQHRVTLPRSEAVWSRCHRRIISDHLVAHGEELLHSCSI
ncbi:DUF488 family protein [Leucobacter sp. W1153]|uniref:DUF488 family protein n=1 Tax=Leucobacter sp. W1153 TaxID=3439064 RepID=UPI003F361CA3